MTTLTLHRQPHPHRAARSGQSLVELVLATPILLLILVGGFSIGLGIYQAHMASDAIKQPSLQKMQMANSRDPVTTGTVLGYVVNGGASGTIRTGAPVDSVQFANADDYTAVIVGRKTFAPAANWIPGFDITVAQPINRKLLERAHNGARVRPANQTWVPGGAPRTPLWEAVANLPPNIQLNPNCQTLPVGEDVVEALNEEVKPDKTYISLAPIAQFSPVPATELVRLAERHAGACANAGAAQCAAERQNLMPDPPPGQPARNTQTIGGPPPATTTYRYEATNPPGGPGTIVTYEFTCSQGSSPYCGMPNMVNVRPNPNVGADHGRYYDPTNEYAQPPADFVDSCMKRKAAECQMQRAIDDANRLIQAAGPECRP